ncbi:MAG: hypothetical protein IKL85_02115, partial [Lentisphaeria bacterium]|nr:hypothetical protein [Lentisphaeria bacterium]
MIPFTDNVTVFSLKSSENEKENGKNPFFHIDRPLCSTAFLFFSEKKKTRLEKLSGRIYFIGETEKTIMPASNTPPIPEKKKHFELMDPVRIFLRDLS